MQNSLDIKGAVVGATAYADNQLVGKNVTFTLPAITFLTADVKAMGDMSVPLIGLLEDLELAVTKIGVDKGLSRMNRLQKQNLEFRWAQNVIKPDGSSSVEGCKAFVRTMPSGIPEIGVEVGSSTEAENTYKVTRIQIFVAGEEFLLVDRLNSILKVGGKDYMKEINNLL